MVLGVDMERMRRVAKDVGSDHPTYLVLRNDENVHAVLDRESGVTGIACFAPATDRALDGCPVRLLSTPALVMARPQADGSLHPSVGDPALHLANGRSQPVWVDVKIVGSLSVGTGAGVDAEPPDGHTLLHLMLIEGKPVRIALSARPRPAVGGAAVPRRG